MDKIIRKVDALFVILTVVMLVGGGILPSVLADTSRIYENGFDKGVSWKPYVPMKRLTFVNMDKNSYLDDYAYLASIPTTVFYDKNTDQLFTSPLLYYEDKYDVEELKDRSLDSRQGIDYFMEDWVSYSEGYLDKMTLINVPKTKIDSDWSSKNYTSIEGTDPFDLASKIAENDWSYSNNAVVAVIQEEHQDPDMSNYGVLTGTVPKKDGVKTESFKVPKTNEVYPIYNEFNVPEGYKFIKVRSWYPSFYIDAGVPGFQGIINMSIPAGDRDLQIYTQQERNGEKVWMMAGITNAWNAQTGMDTDMTSIYAYNSGTWSVSLTDVPTKAEDLGLTYPDSNVIKTGLEVQKHRNLFTIGFGRYGRILEVLQNMRKVMYHIDIEMYPGVMVDIPDMPPYGCRNAQFQLNWNDPGVDLGISLIGPSGEEVLSTREEGVEATCHFAGQTDTIQTYNKEDTGMVVEQLGELLPGEKYSLCVFATEEISSNVDFSIQYSWEQNFTRKEGDCLASATEGAILGSVMNSPLLYTDSSKISKETEDTLYKLGVKSIYLVDLGDYISKDALDSLSMIGDVKEHFTEYNETYNYIKDMTGRNDIIFSTIDPYSYWYVGELEAAGEYPGALSLGPAAYIAAFHGSPVIIIDNHPQLSSAVPWHNELWRRHPDGHSKLPTVSEMYLTGRRVYDFLKDLGFDKEGDETVITLAGQFDIGLTWDRVFVGKAKPGRFIGSPTDLSVWVCKNEFYPQLVFENPALKNNNGVMLVNGSSSTRRFPWRGKLGLKITKPESEERFIYPVLDTLICYDHKFNSRASQYWGFTYICADGDIPGETPSFEPIDVGVMKAVNGEEGGFLADLSGSEVQPFYLERAGYSPVFSTNFDANMYDLNQGVLLWMINTHGGPNDGGLLMFWDVEGENPVHYPTIPLAGYNKETNPWRGYEWLLGSTNEPDTMTSEIHGILPALMGNPTRTGIFTTALDWAAAYRPIRDILGKISSLPIIKWFTPEWFQNTQDYYDGVIITVFLGRFGTSWYNGTEVDDALGNIHSAGISSVACLPAGKYLHLALMRHGSMFQIMDPWATSWYSDVWQNSVPRGIALGKTIGEIYSEGISKVGILYISDPPQWWWDLAENVCLYGDPDLRIWVPTNEYSDKNHWEPSEVESINYDAQMGFFVDGHMPYRVSDYPNTRMPVTLTTQIFWIVAIVALLAVIIIGIIFVLRRRQ